MGSCVRGFLCLLHNGALSQASGWSIVSPFIELAQQILRFPLVLSLFLAGTMSSQPFILSSPLSVRKVCWKRSFRFFATVCGGACVFFSGFHSCFVCGNEGV